MLYLFNPQLVRASLTYDFLLADLATLMIIIVCKPAVCHHISAY
jgi:hypothetical protein